MICDIASSPVATATATASASAASVVPDGNHFGVWSGDRMTIDWNGERLKFAAPGIGIRGIVQCVATIRGGLVVHVEPVVVNTRKACEGVA